MSLHDGMIVSIVMLICILLLFFFVLGYFLALKRYFPEKIRQGKSPGELIDSLGGNNRELICMLIDNRIFNVENMLVATLYLGVFWLGGVSILPHLFFMGFFEDISLKVFLWSGGIIFVFLLIILGLLFGTLRSPFRNFQEPEPTPKENLFDTELIRLQRTKEVLPHIYSQHFWLKLHRNPRKRKQCNPEYVRRWFGMMNLPYDESEDSLRKKQYYLPPYYRRRVRDFT